MCGYGYQFSAFQLKEKRGIEKAEGSIPNSATNSNLSTSPGDHYSEEGHVPKTGSCSILMSELILLLTCIF